MKMFILNRLMKINKQGWFCLKVVLKSWEWVFMKCLLCALYWTRCNCPLDSIYFCSIFLLILSLYESIIAGNDSYLNKIHNIFDFLQVFSTHIKRKLLVVFYLHSKNFKKYCKNIPYNCIYIFTCMPILIKCW